METLIYIFGGIMLVGLIFVIGLLVIEKRFDLFRAFPYKEMFYALNAIYILCTNLDFAFGILITGIGGFAYLYLYTGDEDIELL